MVPEMTDIGIPVGVGARNYLQMAEHLKRTLVIHHQMINEE
jgi:hypothetical protein